MTLQIELTFRACPICVLDKVNEYVQELSKLRPEIVVTLRPTTLEYKNSGEYEHTLDCPNAGFATKVLYAKRYKLSKLPLDKTQQELVNWHTELKAELKAEEKKRSVPKEDQDGQDKGSGLFGG